MNKSQAARRLLKARDRHLSAIAAESLARQEYVEAEKAYIESDDPKEYPANLIVGSVMIMAVEDWYDMPAGQRLSFHTFEVVK